MKKKELKKLSLSKETLAQLTGQELELPAGGSGGWSDGSVCPSVTPSACKPCN
jgi:hypothetical protein